MVLVEQLGLHRKDDELDDLLLEQTLTNLCANDVANGIRGHARAVIAVDSIGRQV